MRVITSFGYNQDSVFDLISGNYIDYVAQFKAHPAIYLWELGNEYNYHPEWFNDDLNNWYDALEQAVDAIHAIDTFHPVTTAHGEIPDSVALYKGRNLDMWGFNVYVGMYQDHFLPIGLQSVINHSISQKLGQTAT